MPPFEEETQLVSVGLDALGRETFLSKATANAWLAMRHAAEQAGVGLLLISGFRSIARQTEIIQRKLAAGQELDAILRVNAYPGFSEHHTGRAIDLGSAGTEHLTEAFEATREFTWLADHASRFGFSLSYPRDNPQGIAYEPWHWCLNETTSLQAPAP